MPPRPHPRLRTVAALVVAAAVGSAGGLGVALATGSDSTATGTVLVASGTRDSADLATGSLAGQVRTSWAAVATTPLVLQPVIDSLHLDTSVAALAKRVHVTAPDGRAVLEIAATDRSAAGATRIADAVRTRLLAVAPSLAPATSDSAMTTLRAAQPVTATPSGPSPIVAALAGGLAGVLLWAVVVVVLRIVRTPRPPRGTPAPSMP